MVNLYLGDCMEAMAKMPDKAYDLAIVDPPYGIGNTNRASRGSTKSIHKGFKWNNNCPTDEYFKELHRVSINQIIWGCNYYADKIPSVGRIIHRKMLTAWSAGKNLSECDLASQSFNKKIEYFEYQWSGNVQNGKINWSNTGTDGRIHPQQKPVALYKWLLQNYAKPGQKILDTHLGSGSIAIACHDYGYDLDGWEIDPEYYAAALKRFETHKAQLKMF